MSVAIIGAGSSGLAACRALSRAGLDVTCFERGSRTGGLWRAGNDNGFISAYPSLSPNTSKTAMQFAEHPMPDDYPDFPSHGQVADYLDDYADRFGLSQHLRLRTGVQVARPRADGPGFLLELDDGTNHECDRLWVASGGHHNAPYVPELPGRFDGLALHSSEYRGAEQLAGKRVLVVGLGASGADIAADVAAVAARTVLAVRTGHYVVPKIVGGRPMDAVSSPLLTRLPMAVRRPFYTAFLKAVQGRMTDYGLPLPPYRLGQAPVVPTWQLLPLIRHGRVVVRPAVTELHAGGVQFQDGTREQFDVVIWCTGFRLSFPFLDPELAGDGLSCPDLYLRAVHPERPELAFIGLLQPLGSTFPVAEAQAEWLAAVASGAVSLPDRQQMQRDVAADRARQRKEFFDDCGGLLVEPHSYLRRLLRERRRLARARRTAASPVDERDPVPA